MTHSRPSFDSAKTVAFCSDIQQFHQDRILDPKWCDEFPGTAWLPIFARLLGEVNCRLTTGDIALKKIEGGSLNARDVIVISQEDSQHAEALLDKGAKGGVIICGESPLFARTFYERIGDLGHRYSARVLFQSTIDSYFPNTTNTFQTRFPSFSRLANKRSHSRWSERLPIVMVASNKYWRTPFSLNLLWNPKKFEAWIRGKFRFSRSSIKKLAREKQLHDTRLEMILHFGRRKLLSLYGAGWEAPFTLPRKWRLRLGFVLRDLKIQRCKDKQLTIGAYRFAFAIENISYPGYHTEKIIDCLASGVIPIYLGDPLIEKFIPKETFINLAHFDSTADLEKYLMNLSPSEAATMLAAGEDFLKAQGDAYSYEAFAERTIALLASL